MKLAPALVAVAALSACVAPRTLLPSQGAPTAPSVVAVRSGHRIVKVPLETYVLGSILSEVSPVNETPDVAARVFAVQAVLARTYTLAHLGRHAKEGFDLCDSTHCQLYEPARIGSSRFTEVARRAVADTRQVVLLFQGHAADAVYHADCGGHTASASDVWGGGPVGYLSGARDDVPSAAHRTWHFETTATRLQAALDDDPRTATGGRLRAITVTHRDESGRAELVELKGRKVLTVRGDVFRSALNRTFGERAIMSTRFSVGAQGPQYLLTGSGFGHGVGLCQVGAAARARRGTPLEMIMAAYFPGTSLTELSVRAMAANPAEGRWSGLLESP